MREQCRRAKSGACKSGACISAAIIAVACSIGSFTLAHMTCVGSAVSARVVSAAADEAVLYYRKSLRGAVAMKPNNVTLPVLRLARLNYAAWSYRRSGDFDQAAVCYKRSIGMCDCLHCVKEVPRAAIAAHAALNLALSMQKVPSCADARQDFQHGVRVVRRMIRNDFGRFVDGHSKCGCGRDARSRGDALDKALQWLATLLVAWALFERKNGNKTDARWLAERASFLDTSKKPVLRWKLMYES